MSEFTAWGSFVRAWGWGVADGSDELQTCGPAQPELTPPRSLCRAGIQGEGKGQLALLSGGMAVDGAGNVWVGDLENGRVEKFNSAGQFLLMIGGDVNQTKVDEGAPSAERDICPIGPADTCQAGSAGTQPSHFSGSLNDGIAYSPTLNAIFIGDRDRIQVFDLDGSFREEIPFEGELSTFDERSATGLDVDEDGNIYVVISGFDDIFKLSPTGEPLDPGKPGSSKFKVKDPVGTVAVDAEGNVFASDLTLFSASSGGMVLEFDSSGNQLLPSEQEEEAGRSASFPYIPFGGPAINGLATNLCSGSEAPGNLYLTAFRTGEVSYLDGYGTPPIGCEPPPPAPPEITAQYATIVKTESATLRAQINPHFWNDTTYYVEYGSGSCSDGGCSSKAPLSPLELTSKVVNKPVTSGAVFLQKLLPGATYHYRFVAESSGGGPVFGADPDGEGPAGASFEEGIEGTFKTFSPESLQPPCPGNEEFRAGTGAKLPDCRGYELVSPLDKSNGDAALLPPTMIFFELSQSARVGDRFTYSSMAPFAEPESAPYISQYLATRDPKVGWQSQSISPPRSDRALLVERSLNNEYKAFAPDLCMGWLRHNSVDTLVAGAVAGYSNLYRVDNCADPASYEALSTAKPKGAPPSKYEVNAVGFSEDGRATIFLADDALTSDAPVVPEAEQRQLLLYEHTSTGVHFICHLPDGSANTTACAAGMAAGQPDGNASSVQNAISADGSEVFWTAYSGGLESADGLEGTIYLRMNPDQEQSPVDEGECTEPAKACTIPVSGAVTPEPAEYWGASNNGSKAIFKVTAGEKKDDLYEFEVDTDTPRLIAKGVEGPMGMSEDASRIYLSSSKVLGGTAGEGAKEGAHNLYLYEAPKAEGEEGSFRFIMRLSGRDIAGTELQQSPVNAVPSKRSATVSADGLRAAFSSEASPTPTGYDNLDAESGKADQEAYLYDATAEKLRCVSCNPTGARPAGENLGSDNVPIWAVARLPSNRRAPLNPPHPLSADGKRLFFESHEALVPRDGNGTWDVYEWEAPGTGSCDGGDSTFNQETGGCVDLISSGESTSPSHLLDADADGSDVFIGTQSSLIASDFGSNDVYDARIDGGFPLPGSKAACEGEGCQNPPGPPGDVTPASEAFEGKGNVAKRKRCRKGTRKVRRHGKVRCATKHKRHGKKRAGHGRRARR